jgi:hypothetical protein
VVRHLFETIRQPLGVELALQLAVSFVIET